MISYVYQKLDDENLQIPGYSIARVDHPSNTKRCSVCVYYKTSLPLRVLDTKHLQEHITLELTIGENLCNFIVLYRSSSQTLDDFEKFMKNFELNLDEINKKNPFLTVALGDFNAKSQTWFKNDKTSYEGFKVDVLTYIHGLNQSINEPTHLLDSSSSCIDLIFTSQPNLVMESGVQPSLHPNCHHQLVFAKFDLPIYYPTPYERTVRYYNRANADLIRRAINLFDWDKTLRFNDVDKQVSIFSDTLMNIMQNFIPNEAIIWDDRDLPWINKEIQLLIEQKNQFYKRFMRSKKSLLNINQFKALQDKLSFLIEKSRNSYYSKLSQKLSNKATSS